MFELMLLRLLRETNVFFIFLYLRNGVFVDGVLHFKGDILLGDIIIIEGENDVCFCNEFVVRDLIRRICL
jgi:hypothetical protein